MGEESHCSNRNVLGNHSAQTQEPTPRGIETAGEKEQGMKGLIPAELPWKSLPGLGSERFLSK